MPAQSPPPEIGMHWDLRHARVFLVVAEEMSFSAAARRLNTSQSAISRTIAQMEADLGAALIERTTRVLSLTPYGQALIEDCREAVATFDRWLQRAHRTARGSAGRVTIGVNDFIVQAGMPRLLRHFRKAYPDIDLALRSNTREAQLAYLDSGEIELGFVMGPMPRTRYSHARIASYGLNCLVPADHPFAALPSVTLADLSGESLILGGPDGWQAFNNYLVRAFAAAAEPLHIHQEVAESVAIFGLIAGGCGITLYPDCQDHVALHGVAKIPVAGLHEPIETFVVWPERHISPSGRAFLEFVLAESGVKGRAAPES